MSMSMPRRHRLLPPKNHQKTLVVYMVKLRTIKFANFEKTILTVILKNVKEKVVVLHVVLHVVLQTCFTCVARPLHGNSQSMVWTRRKPARIPH